MHWLFQDYCLPQGFQDSCWAMLVTSFLSRPRLNLYDLLICILMFLGGKKKKYFKKGMLFKILKIETQPAASLFSTQVRFAFKLTLNRELFLVVRNTVSLWRPLFQANCGVQPLSRQPELDSSLTPIKPQCQPGLGAWEKGV